MNGDSKRSTKVTYWVDHSVFCCKTKFGAPLKNQKCRFCVKTPEGQKCVLHNEVLQQQSSGVFYKLDRCMNLKKNEVAETRETSPIAPQEIMKEAIKIYDKQVNALVNQGYPHKMAQKAALEYVLGNSGFDNAYETGGER